jgi:hypothetical protein
MAQIVRGQPRLTVWVETSSIGGPVDTTASVSRVSRTSGPCAEQVAVGAVEPLAQQGNAVPSQNVCELRE